MTKTAPASPSYKSAVLIIVVTLALLLGVGLLFYEKHAEITVAVPVRFEHIPHGLMAVRNAPVLEARLKGPSRVLKGLKDSQLSYRIDLSTATPGRLFIKISHEMIKLPRRVSILEIHPSSFTLPIEKRIEKMVPIIPDLRKDPAPGWTVCSVVAIPSMARLIGPTSALEKISAVRTTPIDVGGLTETIKKKVALNLNHDPYIQASGNSLIEVEIVVKEEIVEKWLDIGIQATGGNNNRYKITPDRIEILLRGPINTLKKLAQGNGVQVYVELEGLKPGTYVRRAVIKPPLNTTLVKAKPEVFTVRVFE
ncbi:MAG: hypothetical protein DRH17_05385 [Deltaproteobacteria bacterium]|nr:MAG: hypothetical protein DRH17_05385 [Deltaproteobacteria bacterium]